MANPLPVDLVKNTWQKVATGVVSGVIHKRSTKPDDYLWTYRETTDPGPSTVSEGLPAFDCREFINIAHSTPIDVWFYSREAEGLIEVMV